jgi:hypothetical protein
MKRTETLRIKKVEGLSQFFGKGLWKGNLSEMREDRPRLHTRKRPGKRNGKRQ